MKSKERLFYIIIFLAFILIFTGRGGKEKDKEVVLPSKSNSKEILKPEPITNYDTVYVDSGKHKVIESIVRVPNPVNEELLKKYREAIANKDTVSQEEIFKEAITERIYEEEFTDSLQTIKVKSKVIGTLQSQTISYRTKPTIRQDITKDKAQLYAGAFFCTSIEGVSNSALGAELTLLSKDQRRAYSVGFDTNKCLTVGIAIKLWRD